MILIKMIIPQPNPENLIKSSKLLTIENLNFVDYSTPLN